MNFQKAIFLAKLATIISALQYGCILADKNAHVIKLHQETHFVLVHGFGGGGWSWFKIQALLKQAGYRVSSPDLKSAGVDPTDVKSIHTFEQYDEPLSKLLEALPRNQRIVLVGHSSGGLSLTHMIHKFPQKIDMAIFVAATMLRNGFLTEHDIKIGRPQTYATLGDKCRECSERVVKLPITEDGELSCLLCKEGPKEVIGEAIFTQGNRVDEVKRVYIKTLEDKILIPSQQKAMIKKWPPLAVFPIHGDHNPPTFKPFKLFNLIIKAASIPT